jgi:hypothetical protein
MLECAHYPEHVIECALVLQSMGNWKYRMYQFWGMVGLVVIWPGFAPVLALKVITQISGN